MSETENWTKRTLVTQMRGEDQPIEDQIGEVNVAIDRILDRVSKLEKGPADPVTRRRAFDAGPPLPEFFIPVDRGAGTIGGDETRHALEGAPREDHGNEKGLPDPEYLVPVDLKKGIIGGDE